jgi:hypothetical protein
MGGAAPPFLTPALHGDEWSASFLSRFTLAEISPVTRCIGHWVGPRAGLDSVKKRKTLPCRESNTGRLAIATPAELSRHFSRQPVEIAFLPLATNFF